MHLPFYQGDEGLGGEIYGCGLGLAQVSRIVHGVGGRVCFSNRSDGLGLRVQLRFPISDAKYSKKVSNADILAANTSSK
jgi:signal transduction histidine kinase